jgi:hypothetical protein
MAGTRRAMNIGSWVMATGSLAMTIVNVAMTMESRAAMTEKSC